MNVIVIGASHAGVSFADAMRRQGFEGGLTLIDRLAGLPLERPPLSKAYLLAEAASDDAKYALRKGDWYSESGIDLIGGTDVTGIDSAAQKVTLSDGRELAYDRLVLATGAAPRQLPGTDGLNGVFELRHPDDALRLRQAAASAQSAIIIGGGYIGLEVAASLVKTGKTVTVIEAAERLLARVASPVMSSFFADLHGEHGAAVHVGAGVTGIAQADGRFTGVTLADNQTISADMLVVGIGVLPEIALAEMAGADTGNGIQVDENMRTTVDGVYAIGDVARQGDAPRIESVHNASDTAERAAAAILGHELPALQTPWFWSEQYDARLQSAGIVPPPSENTLYIRRPGKRETGFSVWSYDGDRLCAVEAVRDPAGYMLGKTCLDRGVSPNPDQIGDPSFDVKAFVADKSVA